LPCFRHPRHSAGVPGRLVVQPDGKIVATGFANNSDYPPRSEVGIVRHNSDGSLDSSFDGDGIVRTVFSGLIEPKAEAALQPDGKIVIGADYMVNGRHFAVLRYQTDGQLDTAFGDHGVATAAFSGSAMEAGWGAVVVQSDGRVLVSGVSNWSEGGRFAIARFDATGAVDTSFGSGGLAVLDYAADPDWLLDLALQQDGKIVALGVTTTGGGLVRFDSNGQLDTTFGTNGRVDTHINLSRGGTITPDDGGVAIDADGRIVVAG
jgi:uncharacterized delta-60 repeat protein